eukprot:gb/GECH01009638.1/.p1 GENE.gb/GECH01009638.1/~~gb/GECH01009638.1/.p1  ORF type:complete len:1012 (+),score=180.60 gb/GECH01009638.1/:1-3036(+)
MFHRWIVICITLLLGVGIFLKGFFPMKPSSQHSYRSYTPHKNSKFSKVVLLCIDALREDLIYNNIKNSPGLHHHETHEYNENHIQNHNEYYNHPSHLQYNHHHHMPYTQKLLQGHSSSTTAQGFIATAHPPTVTLPRLKALLSGGIPGFLDIVNNLDAGAMAEDNLLRQLIHHRYTNQDFRLRDESSLSSIAESSSADMNHITSQRVVFYGDETWLKMFPEHETPFLRTDRTTAFFVTDTVEVDNNVTRHLNDEFHRDDWDVLILHYLGLDHVGHVGGVHSKLMPDKLQEMDQVIKKIHQWSCQWEQDHPQYEPVLFVIFSDHGMLDNGNHGGASEKETSSVLLFVSSHFKSLSDIQTVDQVDFAPTLASLLGVPIPAESIGVIIPQILKSFSRDFILKTLEDNADQLIQVSQQFSQFRNANGNNTLASELEKLNQRHSCGFQGNQCNETQWNEYINDYFHFLHDTSRRLSSILTHSDLPSLIVGMTAIFTAFLTSLSSILRMVFIGDSNSILKEVFSFPRRQNTAVLFTPILLSSFLYCSIHYGCFTINSSSSISSSVVCHSIETSSFLSQETLLRCFISVSIAFCFQFSVSDVIKINSTNFSSSWISWFPSNFISKFLLFGQFLHLLSLGASSFIEEEHQTWYFLCITFCMLYFGRWIRDIFANYRNHASSPRPSPLLSETYLPGVLPLAISLILRIGRKWNQAGIKWQGTSDIASLLETLLQDQSGQRIVGIVNLFGYILVIAAFTCIAIYSHRSNQVFGLKIRIGYIVINSLGLILGTVFKFGLISSSKAPQAAYALLATSISGIIIYSYLQKRKFQNLSFVVQGIQFTFVCLSFILHRPCNHFLIVLLYIGALLVQLFLQSSTWNVWDIVLINHWFGQASFYTFGHSISIATIDFSGAYTGLPSFILPLIGLFVIVMVYFGPLLFHFSATLAIRSINNKRYVITSCMLHLFLRSCCMLFVSFVLFINRNHLFVWSVFSPKFLYESAFTLLTAAIGFLYICSYYFFE